MGKRFIEPRAGREKGTVQIVSFRGSLAAEICKLQSTRSKAEVDAYVRSILATNDPDLLKRRDGECIVIGRVSERGQFYPDW